MFIKQFIGIIVFGIIELILAVVKVLFFVGSTLFWAPHATVMYHHLKKELEINYIVFILLAGTQLSAIHFTGIDEKVLDNIRQDSRPEAGVAFKVMSLITDYEKSRKKA